LNLKREFLVSNFAFKFNLYTYIVGQMPQVCELLHHYKGDAKAASVGKKYQGLEQCFFGLPDGLDVRGNPSDAQKALDALAEMAAFRSRLDYYQNDMRIPIVTLPLSPPLTSPAPLAPLPSPPPQQQPPDAATSEPFSHAAVVGDVVAVAATAGGDKNGAVSDSADVAVDAPVPVGGAALGVGYAADFGRWLASDSLVVRAAAPMRAASRSCAAAPCVNGGDCNQQTGRCRCPAGWKEPDCRARTDQSACNRADGRDASTSCAGVCDEDAAVCRCGGGAVQVETQLAHPQRLKAPGFNP
jgi:hypothetical protein